MYLLNDALRAGNSSIRRPASAGQVAVIAGAGGSLGSAVLERVLALGGFSRVRALVTTDVGAAMRGFESQTLAELAAAAHPVADTAFIVFDRERHANGREAAFLRPEPADLLALATRLQAAGVRRLLIVLPHTAALLPHALKQGLASLDEQAVAALDFEHLVIVRSAQSPLRSSAPLSPPERLARWWLSQLHFMVPQQDQPVRAVKVADFVARLSHRLTDAAPGTRIVPPELVWLAAQPGDTSALIDAWLLDGQIPSRTRSNSRTPG